MQVQSVYQQVSTNESKSHSTFERNEQVAIFKFYFLKCCLIVYVMIYSCANQSISSVCQICRDQEQALVELECLNLKIKGDFFICFIEHDIQTNPNVLRQVPIVARRYGAIETYNCIQFQMFQTILTKFTRESITDLQFI